MPHRLIDESLLDPQSDPNEGDNLAYLPEHNTTRTELLEMVRRLWNLTLAGPHVPDRPARLRWLQLQSTKTVTSGWGDGKGKSANKSGGASGKGKGSGKGTGAVLARRELSQLGWGGKGKGTGTGKGKGRNLLPKGGAWPRGGHGGVAAGAGRPR